ncbi:Teichoic acid translocation permease protein TagG [Microbacterium azadirachtae]|uniref:Transport permease protein n=1 Tax=Microbacterium azadirachtae TaxID=582680 RepID=A0A0F0LX36_9MICO|nr:Teichoic acid translocation permease protein TagG [Microbacterium azadirachtae]
MTQGWSSPPPRLGTVSHTTAGAPGTPRRYFHSLWLLSARDLRVRYATSVLGYLWSVLDPLVMSAIYWFVFTQVFHRGQVGEQPYIVFLIVALLPWVWFNTAVGEFTRAFKKDARLIRSTAIPRSIWVMRVILTKGMEFAFAIPVLVLFAIFAGAKPNWSLLLFPVAMIWQTVLLVGLGLLVAPLCVLWADLERTTALILRALFYVSPIIYGFKDLPHQLHIIGALNPLSGIFMLYRVGLFPGQWQPEPVIIGAIVTVIFLALGLFTFRSLERDVLKEL